MEKLRFLHIPKTAGSTFARILLNQYKGAPRFVFKGDNSLDRKRFSELSRDEQRSIVLFTGHAPIISGVKEADEIPIITILRDPVNRVKSFCQYVSQGKSGYLLRSFPPETFSLDEFLYSGNSELSNLQSRTLINYEKRGAELIIRALTQEEIIAKALDNLINKVTCFGLQEYFDESLILFSNQFSWRTPYYEYRNRKDGKNLLKFEERHIEKIKELNAIDIKFYKEAKERFVDVIRSDEKFRQRCEDFKRIQKVASPMLKLYGDVGRYVKNKRRQILKD